jgi:diguanylate cyclase (GGDEF)-like protein/PAS domain S-box-containing protein
MGWWNNTKVSHMPLSISSYSLFLETLPDALLLVNSSGKIVLANSQANAMFGYKSDGLKGQSIQILVPKTQRETHTNHMVGFFSNPKRRMMGTVMELVGRRGDGSEFAVDIMLSPIELDGIQFVVCSVRDITQIKQMQEALKKAFEYEKELARVDALTGAANQRSFYELAQREIEHSRRYKYPFIIGYFDLDDFKAINDKSCHRVGDEILSAVVKYATGRLRKTDLFARLGGDEFAFLLPETEPELAQTIISRFQEDIVLRIQEKYSLAMFSIGMLTCIDSLLALEEILKIVDDLTYSVKREGKAGIKYSVHRG